MKQLKPKPRYDYTFFKGLEAMNSEAITKQEEIREGIANIIAKGREDECITLDIAQRLINYLHSKGVVIKADRELPDNKIMRAIVEDEQHKGEVNWYYKAILDMHRAGYVAVEDLI